MRHLTLPSKKLATRANFTGLLSEVKGRIQSAQTRAMLAANSELVRLYWDIGRVTNERQKGEGWGAAVIPRLTRALHNELPEVKGLSERNIKRMLAFYREYREPTGITREFSAPLPDAGIVPQAVAQTLSTRHMNSPRRCGGAFKRGLFLKR